MRPNMRGKDKAAFSRQMAAPQPGVVRFGFFQDGDVGVGVFSRA